MKTLFTSLLALLSLNSSFAQFDCNTIQVNVSTFYLNQATDNSITMDYTYDMTTNPMVFYPSFEIILTDSTEIAFRDFYATSMLSTGTFDYTISYKNPTIANGSSFPGNFTISGNTDTEGFTCQFPVNFIFQTGLAVENAPSFENTLISPNPSNGNYTVQFGKQLTNLTATVRNSAGQIVSTENQTSADGIQITISGPAGIYFLELNTPTESKKVMKLVKE